MEIGFVGGADRLSRVIWVFGHSSVQSAGSAAGRVLPLRPVATGIAKTAGINFVVWPN